MQTNTKAKYIRRGINRVGGTGGGGSTVIIVIVGLVLFLGLGIGFIYHKRKQAKARLEQIEPAIFIKKPFIITIAIGQYDDDIYQHLNVEFDVGNIARLFQDVLGYRLHPGFVSTQNVQTHWTRAQLLTFLVQKSEEFNQKRDKYDSLVVIFSCHGVQNHIITSDNKIIEKQAIHRIFSFHYPHSRNKPRLFLFDTCEYDDMLTSEQIGENQIV